MILEETSHLVTPFDEVGAEHVDMVLNTPNDRVKEITDHAENSKADSDKMALDTWATTYAILSRVSPAIW